MDISAKDAFQWTWMNKNMSWKYKYAFPMVPDYKHWYYWWSIAYKERFMFSTTMLVFLSDGWHLAQFVFLKSISAALAFNMRYSFVVNFMIVNVVYAIVFNGVYEFKKYLPQNNLNT